MQKFLAACFMLLCCTQASAEPSQATLFKVFFSVVQIHVENKDGEHGVGSGIVVAPDHIATNCHVLANARGIIAAQGEDNYRPVALKADWRHDLCLLKFDGLALKPVVLGETANIKYEQAIFSLGHSGGQVAPAMSLGRIKALYSLDDGQIIRTSARFSMGASGSALFDEEGKLLGINTFKSPGQKGFFYALPVEWVKALFNAPEVAVASASELPFWDAPEEKRPFFMRVVPYLQAQQWEPLKNVAQQWTEKEANSAEAWYYLGLAETRLNDETMASQHLHKAVALNSQHADALYELGIIAASHSDKNEMQRINLALYQINDEMADAFRKVVGCAQSCQ